MKNQWHFPGRMLRRLLLGMSLVVGLSACGGDGSGYQLVGPLASVVAIDGPETQSNIDPKYVNWLDSQSRWFVEGDGFLPPGTVCARTQCKDSLGFMSSASLGPYEMSWTNSATGQSGVIGGLSWFCYCQPAPRWSAFVPVVPGANRITVTQRAGTTVQTDEVLVMIE